MNDIKVWTQMFFDDGSVTQGLRVDACIYDDDRLVEEVARKLLGSVRREEGFLLIWGAGEMSYRYITSASKESDS